MNSNNEAAAREYIWQQVGEYFYYSYLTEIYAGKLVYTWIKIDEITKVLVALTASGSAVSGWSLWNSDSFGGKTVWALIAGFAAFLSIVHNALAVPERIKKWTEIKNAFIDVRSKAQTSIDEMIIDPNFDIPTMLTKLGELRETYTTQSKKVDGDWLLTSALKEEAERELKHKTSAILTR